MGHKVHPYGFRIGIIKPWLAKWYADRDYATLLQEDMRIRELVARQLSNASVSQVEIERGINHVTVTVHTAKPGIVIGKGGANVEALRTNIGKLTDKKVKLEIKEILQPELDGMLLAQNVAGQLERRIAFRKAIKQSIQRTIKAGAKGVKIQVSGRLGGSEMSRTEWDKEGPHPARHAARRHQLRRGPRAHHLRRASASRRGSTAVSSSAIGRAAPAPSRAPRAAARRRAHADCGDRHSAGRLTTAAVAAAEDEPMTRLPRQRRGRRGRRSSTSPCAADAAEPRCRPPRGPGQPSRGAPAAEAVPRRPPRREASRPAEAPPSAEADRPRPQRRLSSEAEGSRRAARPKAPRCREGATQTPPRRVPKPRHREATRGAADAGRRRPDRC